MSDDILLIERVWVKLKLPPEAYLTEYQRVADYTCQRLEEARIAGWDERFTTVLVRSIAEDYLLLHDDRAAR